MNKEQQLILAAKCGLADLQGCIQQLAEVHGCSEVDFLVEQKTIFELRAAIKNYEPDYQG
jgi:hypothetical protein